jgi:uncharacterized membrane protein (UPF0127 family)
MLAPMKAASLAGLLLAALLFGCNRPSPPPPAATVAEQQPPSGQPQPQLPIIKMWLGDKEIVAEQATTGDQVQTGMMFRKAMGENEGMLFIFARAMQASFWMRNTLIPLSCAYIDPSGTILEVHDMKPLDETPIQASSDQVQYVLEMKQGWFERNHIGVGTSVRTERGSLSQTYFHQP